MMMFIKLIPIAAILATAPAFGAIKHIVQKGDDLLSISSQYFGDPQCWTYLLQSNPQLLDQQKLKEGQSIAIHFTKDCTLKTAPKKKNQLVVKTVKKHAVKPKKQTLEAKQINTELLHAPNEGHLTLQLASYPNEKQALAHKQRLHILGIPAVIRSKKVKRKTWYRVQIGRFTSKNHAMHFAKKIDLKNTQKKFIVMPL